MSLRTLRRLILAIALLIVVIGLAVLAIGWNLLGSADMVWAPSVLHMLVPLIIMAAANAIAWLITKIEMCGRRWRVIHVARGAAGIGALATMGLFLADGVTSPVLAAAPVFSVGVVIICMFIYIEQVAEWLADGRVHVYARRLLWAVVAFIAGNCVLAFGIAVLGLVSVLYEFQIDVLWLVGMGAWVVSAIAFATFCEFALAMIAKRLWQILQQLNDDTLARL